MGVRPSSDVIWSEMAAMEASVDSSRSVRNWGVVADTEESLTLFRVFAPKRSNSPSLDRKKKPLAASMPRGLNSCNLWNEILTLPKLRLKEKVCRGVLRPQPLYSSTFDGKRCGGPLKVEKATSGWPLPLISIS